MSTTPLPGQVDVRKWAGKGAELNTVTSVSMLPRFVDLLASTDSTVAVDLRFYTDDERKKCIDGHVRADVEVYCQRCLEPMPLALDVEFSLGIVWSEDDAQRLRSSLEPLIVGEELVDLADVVSEELILSMPFVSYHAPEDCKQEQNYSTVPADEVIEPVPEQGTEKRENPFKVLEQLKRDK